MSDNKQFIVHVDGRGVSVSEEVYLMYYRLERRMRYFERDIKTESAVRDRAGKIVGYKPAKEDSLNRLMEAGEEYSDQGESIEETILHAAMADHLYDALQLLTKDERALVDALFFSHCGEGMTEREYASLIGVSQQSVNERKRRIFSKLKKLLGN